jgi:crossover junction endodeoxyribonuclease RusA
VSEPELLGASLLGVWVDEVFPAAPREVFELDLPLVPRKTGGKPCPPLNHNQRLHWRRESTLKKLVRLHAKNQATKARIGRCSFLTVQLHYAPGDNRTVRDPANLTATSKPAIDGLVDAGLVPDDNPTFLDEVMPVIHPGPGVRRLWLTLEVTR